MSFGLLHSGELLSLVCAMTWAVAVLLFRKSGERVTPVALNLFKNAIALGLFLITLPLIGVPYFPEAHGWRDWVTLLASGALGIGVADSMFFTSLNRLGASNSALVDALYCPFVILCAWFYLGEPIGPSLILSVLLMAGAIILGTWQRSSGPRQHTRGQIAGAIALGIFAHFLMAVGIVVAKPVLAHADGWWVATVRLSGGAAFLVVHGLMPRHRADTVRCFRPGRTWVYSVPSAVIGAYIAMILWILGMKYTFASVASVLNQMSTIFIMILAAIFLKERLTPRRVVAILMAFSGAVIVAL